MVELASVIIPLLTQNDEWLEQSVRSALQQSCQVEVIVVTSARTPIGNQRVLKELGNRFSNLEVFPQSGSGFANAINSGVKQSRTNRIGLLLSDDWLEPAAVATCLKYEADIVSTGLTVVAEDGRELEELGGDRTQKEFDRLPSFERKANYLSHFFLFQKPLLEKVGLLDESLGDPAGIDDYDLIWTLLEHRASVQVVEQRLYWYRDHSATRLTLRPREESLATLGRILDKHGVSGVERKRLLQSHGRWFGMPIHVAYSRLK